MWLERTLVTLWHSALLFILFSPNAANCQDAKKAVRPLRPANYQIVPINETNFQCVNVDFNLTDVSFQWRVNGHVLQDKITSSIDLMQEASDSQSLGKVECWASNPFGTSYAFTTLTNGTFSDSNENATLEVTFDSGVLACKCADDCQTIEWFKDGEPISNLDFFQSAVMSGSEQHLQFTNTFFDSSGTYGCLVYDQHYKEASVDIEYKPGLSSNVENLSQVLAGSSVSFNCSVRSQKSVDDLQFEWMFNNTVMDCFSSEQCQISEAQGGQQLTLKSVRPSDSGHYKCIAYDSSKQTFNELQLNVKDETPKIFNINVSSAQGLEVMANPRQFFLLENSELVLNCNHNGSKITWSLPNRSQVQDINPLVIDSVNIEDHQGDYFCTVSSSFGLSVQEFTSVAVIQPARIRSNDTSTVQVEPPNSVTLNCDAIVDERLISAVFIQWSKDDIVLAPNSSELNIDKVTKDDSGTYKCSLKSNFSFLNEVTQQWRLEVKQSPDIFPSFPSQLPLLQGDSKSVACYAKGIPNPTVHWEPSKDDGLIFPRNVMADMDPSFDVVTHLDLNSSGIFKCLAQNDHGDAFLGIEVITVNATEMVGENNTVIEADAGSAITLNCSIIYDPKLEDFGIDIKWFKDGNELSDDGVSLTIPYLIDREHQGIYSCRLTTAVDALETVQHLTVKTAPPKIKGPALVTRRVQEGHNTTLECNLVGGIPKPNIQWKFGDETIEGAANLTIKHINASLEGTYTCLAVNEYGNDFIKYDLKVIQRPVMLEGPEDLEMKTFGTVRFPCTAQIDKRVLLNETTIKWFYNISQELANDEPHHLVINEVTKDHVGSYSCIVNTPFGSLNQTAKLSVLGEPPSFIATEKKVQTIEGKSAVLSCQANGMPLPKIYWQKLSKNITETSAAGKFDQARLGDLTISDIAHLDQGIYQCFATNIYGTISTDVEVEVIRKSKPSDDQTLAREVVKNVHDNVTLDCGISFDPRLARDTTVQWFKSDSQPINLNLLLNSGRSDLKYMKLVNNELLINDLGVDDEGKYSCTVKTPYESLQYSVQLFVHGEPPKIISNLKKITLYEGEDLIIPCLAKGVPLPSLKWLFNEKAFDKDNVEIVEKVAPSEEIKESIMTIKRVTKIHEGVYQCEAGNTYGSGVAKFATVNVVKRTSVMISEDEISVNAGQNLRIPCNFKHDPLNRVTNIQWYVNDEDIKVGSKDRVDFGMDGSITISNVQKRHSGVYRCTVTTKLDNATATVPVRIIVNAPVIVNHSEDQVLFSGNTISLLCKANGIPAPQIHWKFNETSTKQIGEDYVISNAMMVDSGIYSCEASNQYGKTNHAINVKVVPMAPLQAEYLVNLDDDLNIPCFEFESGRSIDVSWRLNGRLIDNPQVFPNGSLQIQRMSEEQSGAYSCSASLPNGRRSFVQTNVRLRPEIILSQGKALTFKEGDDIYLECLLVRGVQAKRVWQFNGEYEYGDRTSYQNQGGLLIIHKALPSDSGNYTCLAQKKSSNEHDSIEYALQVESTREHWTPGNTHVAACSKVKDQPVEELQAFKLDNKTVGITWNLPPSYNQSCYEYLALTWWSNATDSSFSEMKLQLEQTKVKLSGLSPNLTYFVQVNLIAPLNLQVYGHTLKFNLPSLSFGQFPQVSETSGADQEAFIMQPLVIVVISVVTVLISILLVLCFFKWWQKHSKPNHRFARNSVHLRHSSAVNVCCYQCSPSDWCYGSNRQSPKDDHMFQKTNFNGFDTGMYESAIINTSDSRPAAAASAVTSSSHNKRASILEHAAKNNGGDFMSNLTPQWPEPEEAPLSGTTSEEYDPFIRHHHHGHPHSTFDPPHLRRHGSKESISSSWSSLFNVPGTSSGTVSVRPNSVAVSNLSSSGSAADYNTAKGAFIANKYRRNN